MSRVVPNLFHIIVIYRKLDMLIHLANQVTFTQVPSIQSSMTELGFTPQYTSFNKLIVLVSLPCTNGEKEAR